MSVHFPLCQVLLPCLALAAKEVPEVTAVNLVAGLPGTGLYPSLGYSNMGYSSMGYPAGNPYGYSGYPAVNSYGYSGYPAYSTPYSGYSGYRGLPTNARYFNPRLAPASPYTPYMPANSYMGLPQVSPYMEVHQMPKAPSSQFHAQDEMGNLNYGYKNINSAKVTTALYCRVQHQPAHHWKAMH